MDATERAKLKAREAYWRTRTQFYRRAEKRQRAETMRLQAALHEDDRNVTVRMVTDAKGKLADVRQDVRRAEAALAKIRDQLAEVSGPRFITAAQLGLRFQYVFGGKGDPYRGAGHYTAGRRVRNATELAQEMRNDHRFHGGKGWGGLSYEVMVADDGTIGFGNPINRKAAAVANNNTGMVGICCPGTTGDRMTAAQKRSVRWLLDNWHTRAVPAAHRLPKPARKLGWRGHREYPGQSTACPGVMLADYKEVF